LKTRLDEREKMRDNGGGIKKIKVKDQEVDRKKERKVEN